MKKIWLFISLIVCMAVAGCTDKVGETIEPSVILETEALEFGIEGGEASAGFSVSSPVATAELSAESDADWIRNVILTDNTVSFIVDPMDVGGERSANIRLDYEYPDKGTLKTVSASLAVSQTGPETDKALVAKDSYAELIYQEGAPLYQKVITFSEKEYGEPSSVRLAIMILDEKPSAEEDMILGEGDYVIGKTGDARTIWSASYYKTDNLGSGLAGEPVELVKGSLHVTGEGDGYVYEGEFEDTEGNTYYSVYKGTVKICDRTGFSYIDEDIEAGMDNLTAKLVYSGKGAGESHGWHLEFFTPDDIGEFIMIDLSSIPTTVEAGLPSGTYTAFAGSGARPANTFAAGHKGSITYVGSWYMTVNGDKVYRPSGPFTGGTLTVENQGAGFYKFTLDMTDDAIIPHHITGVWSGMPELWTETIE